MYLPTNLWHPSQSVVFLQAYTLSAGDDDWVETVTRWLSAVLKASLEWLQTTFSSALAWIKDTAPVVGAWLASAAATASEPPIFLLLLTLLGFSIRGIVAGSPAASYQSLCYGGNTPAASLFAILQSIGMKYHAVTSGNWVLAVVRLFAGVVFVYVVLGMTVLW